MVPVREPLLLFGRERKNCGGGCVEMKKLCEVEVEGGKERGRLENFSNFKRIKI